MRPSLCLCLGLAGGLALLTATPAALGQALPPDTLACDRFRDNTQGWFVGTAATRSATLDPTGGYHLAYTGAPPTGAAPATAVFALNDQEDYLVEAQLRLRGQGGLMLGYTTGRNQAGGNDYRIFTVQAERVQVLHYVGGSAGLVAEVDAPLPPGFDRGAWHRFGLARSGNGLRFFLDGQPLGAVLPAPAAWPGPEHNLGFFVQNTGSELWARQFLVRHHSLIRLAAGVPHRLQRERLAGLSTVGGAEGTTGVSADGRWLYFTRRLEISKDDIYRAERQADGGFGAAESLGTNVNSERSDAVAHVSPDGQTLVVKGRYDPATGQKTSNQALSQTTRQPNGSWARPTLFADNMDLPGGSVISHFVGASGTVALVAGDTDQQPGNPDLYVSLRHPDGGWGPLRPLGPALNTPGVEDAPFLAADGKTLYFASDGHPGYGALDIFVTTRLDDSWTKWSPPQNLGPGVNTARFESFFYVPAQGAYAYLTSTEPGAPVADTDLYRLRLVPTVQPAPTVLVHGRVLNARTNQPVPGAVLRAEILPDGTATDQLQLSGLGTYKMALPAGRSYGFGAQATGYVSAYDHLDLRAPTAATLELDLYLLPLAAPVAPLPAVAVRLVAPTPAPTRLPVALTPTPAPAPTPADTTARLVLRNLFFVQGQPTLLPASFPELNRLTATLRENIALRIRLDGHTDNQGDAKDPRPNQRLSEARAAAVRTYLVAHGVAAGRLSTRGYGGQQPVAPNDTEPHMAQNRRVELVVVSR